MLTIFPRTVARRQLLSGKERCSKDASRPGGLKGSAVIPVSQKANALPIAPKGTASLALCMPPKGTASHHPLNIRSLGTHFRNQMPRQPILKSRLMKKYYDKRNIFSQTVLTPFTCMPSFSTEATDEKEHAGAADQLSYDKSPGLFSLYLLMCFVLASFMIGKAYADEPDDASDRIDHFLQKLPSDRQVDEILEIFDYVLDRGDKEIQKAKGKDIVIFIGNTSAGKSTLINYLYGCQMRKDGNDNIEIDPNSKIKAVVAIGTGTDSCTLIPKKIPELSDSIGNDSDSSEDLNKIIPLSFYDMPGLSDSRGIEIAIANLILAKRLVNIANSVRVVMLFDYNQLKAENGEKWVEAVRLLKDTFNSKVGLTKNSICLVFTKTNKDIATIKREIKKYTKAVLDLSGQAIVYNPLNSDDRDRLFKEIINTKSFSKIPVQIAIAGAQFDTAHDLGRKIADEVEDHLSNSNSGENENEMDLAVKKTRFTHSMGDLGNKKLAIAHGLVSSAIGNYAASIITGIDPSTSPALINQVADLRKYKRFRSKFKPYVSFEKTDRSVNTWVHNTKDNRMIAWNNGSITGLSLLSTAACVGGGFIFPPLWAGAVVSAGAFVKGAVNYMSPAEEDANMTELKKGIS